MEISRQQCQQCGAFALRIVLVADHQPTPESAYVQCAECDALVAVYEIARYYNNQDGIESYLLSQGSEGSESGRLWLSEFRSQHEQAETGFQKILEHLRGVEEKSKEP